MQLRIYVLPGNLWLYVKICLCLVLFNTVTYTQCNICSTCFVEIIIQLDMFIYVYIATFSVWFDCSIFYIDIKVNITRR